MTKYNRDKLNQHFNLSDVIFWWSVRCNATIKITYMFIDFLLILLLPASLSLTSMSAISSLTMLCRHRDKWMQCSHHRFLNMVPSHPQSVKIIQQGIIKHHRITFKGHRLKVTKSIFQTIQTFRLNGHSCKCFWWKVIFWFDGCVSLAMIWFIDILHSRVI